MEFQAAGVMLAWDGGLDTRLPMTDILSSSAHGNWCTHRNVTHTSVSGAEK